MSDKPPLALSFDVECYYQIVAKDYLGQDRVPSEEPLRNTNWVLDLLKAKGARATFFFLGNIAERFPQLIERAAAEGHEIGVHGDRHDYLHDMTPDRFREEIATAMRKIRAAGGRDIAGHRATAFSVTEETLWALDVLKELGLRYDSSIFPFAGARYGIAGWPRRPGPTEAGIAEVPMSVIEVAGRKIPAMGGGYVRYFPLAYTKYCARRLAKEGLTPISYFHPYEFEAVRPEFSEADTALLDQTARKRFKRFNRMQSIGRGAGMRRKLEWLVDNHRTVAVGDLVPAA